MRESTRPILTPEVAIISASTDTLEGLESYLRAAGVSAHGTLEIEELPRLAKTNVDAFVLFPDDYRWETVLAAIAGVVQPRAHPRVGGQPQASPRAEMRMRESARANEKSTNVPLPIVILVTAHPQRFEDPKNGEHVFVVPRPAWSWTILDVIRAHTDPDGDGSDEGGGGGLRQGRARKKNRKEASRERT